MVGISYHASHEQFTPRDLVRFVQAAERAGFSGAMSSDHAAPWSDRQGQSGFALSWMGAALQATHFPIGMITIPGGWRFHPVVIAQATATLAQMFPGRFPWVAFGSGEALNERVVGEGWPDKPERHRRLRAAVDIVRALWNGETVSSPDPIPTLDAKLYTLPETPPLILGAALSPETAEWCGGWADGLITINQPREKLAGIVEAFRRGGGSGKPLYLQVHVSWAEDDGEARANAFDQWRSNAIPAHLAGNLPTPDHFEEATRDVRPEDMDEHVRISSDPARHAAWITEDISMGFSEIVLHNVGRNQQAFIEFFGREVLPRVHRDVPPSGTGAAT
ncbi:LLM class F420-dependent oxidoreductase [Agaricicola taiwanensis]|uniref:LLM class F420-dependent oxidoreductase n=1 Tax=Agaricicola taiwanensis TaxID=591372 RepID=A0A8J2YF70_9RHOB|nr:TIGR03885 family FMN-dependent LLM class oxidoreductase [Agaricicola taiwanensis]GGE28626.1 LLM class F420-dependent oxidoreductase [Agaricicola taiwanensis]